MKQTNTDSGFRQPNFTVGWLEMPNKIRFLKSKLKYKLRLLLPFLFWCWRVFRLCNETVEHGANEGGAGGVGARTAGG